MADLRRKERQFTIATVVLAVAIVALAVYLMSPLSPSRDQKASELNGLQNKYRSERQSPFAGVPEKLSRAQTQIVNFYRDRVPTRYSTLAEDLGGLARESGIQLTNVSYASKAMDTPGMTQVVISTNVVGNYANVARFINAIERSKTFYVIDTISLSGQQTGDVGLSVTIETYLRDPNLTGGNAKAPNGKQAEGDKAD